MAFTFEGKSYTTYIERELGVQKHPFREVSHPEGTLYLLVTAYKPLGITLQAHRFSEDHSRGYIGQGWRGVYRIPDLGLVVKPKRTDLFVEASEAGIRSRLFCPLNELLCALKARNIFAADQSIDTEIPVGFFVGHDGRIWTLFQESSGEKILEGQSITAEIRALIEKAVLIMQEEGLVPIETHETQFLKREDGGVTVTDFEAYHYRSFEGRHILFDREEVMNPLLRRLLALFDIAHDGTLQSVRDATQEAWYQRGKLRAEIEEQHGGEKALALSIFSQLGFLNAIEASHIEYDDALVLGATIPAVRKRLAFLRDEWNRGVRFHSLILLGSERALIPGKETPEVLFDPQNKEFPFPSHSSSGSMPEHEAAMMQCIYEQVRPELPWEGQIAVKLICAPKKDGKNPNTLDTLEHWMEEKAPEPERVLAVSSQPFVSYQDLVLRRGLSERFSLDAIGPMANTTLPISVFLDNLAKIIFELARG